MGAAEAGEAVAAAAAAVAVAVAVAVAHRASHRSGDAKAREVPRVSAFE